MTSKELNTFLDTYKAYIEWQLNDGAEDPDEWFMLFRNNRLAWYQADEKRATKIMMWKLETMTTSEIIDAVNRGLMVDGITRITGYFTKVSYWNPGKRAELKDRHRVEIGPKTGGC
jgi:hypothetical protein